MKWISHRGNTAGPDPKNENKIKTINACLDKGLDVEVDIWFENNKFFLGHDSPDELLNIDFFKINELWFHLKNLNSLKIIKDYSPLNYFWHEEDKCTITSSGKFWLYPGNNVESKDSIFVLPENFNTNLNFKNYNIFGVCTDYIDSYKKKYKN
tara:strand:+ start:175 stop:633 length:459 start_codon:yes stop_codon:yes gene_type:complete